MSTPMGPWVADLMSDWLSGKTIKAMLVKSTFAESPDYEFRSAISSHEVSGTGYTAGGNTVSGLSATYDAPTNRVMLDCSDISFGTLTLTDLAGIVFYYSTGSSATDQIIASDVWATEALTAEAFTYAPSANGIVTTVL